MPTILLVDDEPLILEILTEYFRTNSETAVRSVADGKRALEEMLTEPPDLVITDLSMPEMDGFELIENMERLGLQIPVIVISGKASQQDQKRAKDLGAQEFLTKPLNLESLRGTVDFVLSHAVDEVRQAPRIPVKLRVKHVDQEGGAKVTYESETINCSVTGLCFKWYLSFKSLSQSVTESGDNESNLLDLVLYDPEDKNRKLQVRAKVVHCVRIPDMEFDYVGAEFVDLNEVSERQLRNLLSETSSQ
ncbi:MAG: response regulator [Planctomycetota bacterium]|jgi:DNA-binding response OmpR family regulator|nr:response regulator [Planctomycetota bacterium]